MRIERALRVVLVLAGLLLAIAPARGDDKDRWYVMEMAGAKAGWMHTWQRTEGARVVSSSRMEFRLSRGEAKVSMKMSTEFVETPAGEPVSMKNVQEFGAMAITQVYTFREKDVEIVSEQNGKSVTTTALRPEGPWLTPVAAEAYSLQRLKSGAKEIVVKTLDPSNGLVIVTATRTGFDPAKVMVLGREVDALKTSVRVSVMPGLVSTEYIDGEGELIRSETNLGGMPIVLVASSEEEATRTKGAPAPEVMVSTFVKPDRPIKNARRTTKATYLLTMTEGDVPEPVTTGAQRTEKAEKGVRVYVDAGTPSPAPQGDVAATKYLASTAMCNASDEVVKQLAAKAVAGAGEDPQARARAIRAFVHDHITQKNMDVGLASASEVARNGAGDCSEHGVLTAALLRAQGIPSRVAAGLLYVDEFGGARRIFGYHMWTQALLTIDGAPRWVDLDATLPGAAFDATHITLGLSALEDGDALGGLMSIAATMGRLKIGVEHVE